MDEGTAGSGRVAEDDGDESSSGGCEGNEAATMPVSRTTVTESNAPAATEEVEDE